MNTTTTEGTMPQTATDLLGLERRRDAAWARYQRTGTFQALDAWVRLDAHVTRLARQLAKAR